MGNGLRDLRLAKGWTHEKAADAMGVSRGQFIKLERGERGLTERTIERAAKAFGASKSEVLGDQTPVDEPISIAGGSTVVFAQAGARVPIVGTVEAGAYREFDDSNQDEPEHVTTDPDKRWPDARLVAMRVAGDSMNALTPVPIFDGATIVCVDYEDIADRYPMRTGLIVVVQRVAMGGHIREWSVKQLEVQDDHYIFHPRSTNAKHKPIIVTTDLQADDGTIVSVLALVRRIDNPVVD